MADNIYKGGEFTPYGYIPIPQKKPRNLYEALPLYIKEKAKGVKELFTTYDKILKGEIDPDSDIGRETAMAMATLVGTGGMATSGAVGGPGTLGMFIGRNARDFDKAASLRAFEMKNQGYSPREIWEATGTRRWQSGPRQEIPDNFAKFNENIPNSSTGKVKLQDALDHPELFKNYPHLRDVSLHIDSNLKPGHAWTDPESKVISISEKDFLNKDISTILHEIQHNIQYKEKWDYGSNPDYFLNYTKTHPQLTEQELANNLYYATPGEVESRNTEIRKDLTREERKKIFPDDTHDVSPNFMKFFKSEDWLI